MNAKQARELTLGAPHRRDSSLYLRIIWKIQALASDGKTEFILRGENYNKNESYDGAPLFQYNDRVLKELQDSDYKVTYFPATYKSGWFGKYKMVKNFYYAISWS